MNKPYLKRIYYGLLLLILILLLQPKGGTWAYLHHIRWLYILILGFVISILLVPICIRLAHKFNLLDHPDERKVHKTPIPRIGGPAIFIAFIITVIRNQQFSKELNGLLIGAGLIFLVGFIDDVRGLSATVRFIVQIIAGLIIVKSGIVARVVPILWPASSIINPVITIIWFVGIVNAVNFLDGIDGLACSFGILCSLLFFFIAWPTEQKYLAYLNIALIGVCLGFLYYNWSPAKIFLGDSGATFIGAMLAGMAVMGSWAENNPTVALSTPLLILSIPIFDMIYITISRIRNGHVKTIKQWLEYVGKDHFHHRLLKLGFSVRWAVGFIILVNLCLGLGALIIRDAGTKGSFILLVQAYGILTVVVILMLMGRSET